MVQLRSPRHRPLVGLAQSVWCIGMWLMCMLCVKGIKMNLVNSVEPLKTYPVACVCWKHVFNKVMHAYLGWSRS